MNNFYFLVKECGISPLEIPKMTPLQVELLIREHNRIQEKQKKEIERLERKAKPARRTMRRARRYRR